MSNGLSLKEQAEILAAACQAVDIGFDICPAEMFRFERCPQQGDIEDWCGCGFAHRDDWLPILEKRIAPED